LYKNNYLTYAGYQFVLLAAPTRSGKGVGIVIGKSCRSVQRTFVSINHNPNADSDERYPRQKKTRVNRKAYRFIGSMAVHHKVLNDRPRSARIQRQIENPHKYETADKKNHQCVKQGGKYNKQDFQERLRGFHSLSLQREG